MHNSEKDRSGNSTEVCSGSGYYCFAVWSNRKLPDNTTVTIIIRKGCFRISYTEPDEHPCGHECIQRPAFDSMSKEKNISGFCCCDTSYCNRNFTMTEYDLSSPSPSKKPGIFIILFLWRGRGLMNSSRERVTCTLTFKLRLIFSLVAFMVCALYD